MNKKLLWNCLFLFWRNHLFSFCLSTFHRLVFFWNFSHFAAGKRSWLLYLQKIFLIYSVWPLYRENISIRIDKTSLALDWVYAMVPIPSQIVKMFLWTCSVQYFLLNRQIFELENDTKMLKFHYSRLTSSLIGPFTASLFPSFHRVACQNVD